MSKKGAKLSLSELLDELRWIFEYVKKYRLWVALYIVIGFFSSVLALSGSVLSKKLINAVTGRDGSSITLLAVLYVAFGVTNIFLTAVMSRISVSSSTRVTCDIRREVYSDVLCAKWLPLSAFRSGDVLNRVNNDVLTVSSAVLTWIPNFITKFFQFCCAFLIILRYDKIMAFIALVGSPVTVLVSSFFLRKMRENSKEVRKASSGLVAFLGESLSRVSNIKAFDLVSDFTLRFESVQTLLNEAVLSQNRFSVLASAVVSFLGLVVSYSCFGWSVYRLWSGKIDFGTMAMFLQLSTFVSSSFGALVSLVPGAVSSAVAARRLMELSSLKKEELQNAERERAFVEENKASGLFVHLENVRADYESEKAVLKNVDFVASPGEIVALKGRSGAGKTTVLRLLLALVDGEGGLFLEDEKKNRVEISPKTRPAFSLVPQGGSLFAGTIEENLRLGKPDATAKELESALKTACAFEFVNEMPEKEKSLLGENGVGLSEGQAQRISIARAVLRESPVLLLDEATSALDSKTERALLENLVSLGKKRTVIVTTHRESVLSCCDRIYSVENGTLTEEKGEEKNGKF